MALVSVIIPTTRRPKLLLRALASVLDQTHRELEVIIVVDGPNPETLAELDGIGDPRVRVLQNRESLGPGVARNLGAEQARGEWIAFLDDDDEWLPRKLELQLAGASVEESTMLSCRCRVLTAHATYEWPRRVCDGGIPVDEYLWGRRSLFRGEAYLATASFVMPRRLFAAAQFGTTRHNEDDTLLLRLTKQHGARIRMLPEVLVVIHAEDQSLSLGANFVWRESLTWLDGMGSLVTPRAYSGFCLVILASQAKRSGDYGAFPLLLRRSLARGRPTPMQLLLFVAFWLLPMNLRQRLRALSRHAGSVKRRQDLGAC
jgi:glycosyltransferase involved in cell wall biosynthesis